MKKKLVAIITVMLMIVAMIGLMPTTALAADDLDMSVDFTPTSLLEAGDITLTVSITNKGDDVSDAVLKFDGETLKEFGNITAGGTKDYEGAVAIKSTKIGKSLKVELTYTYNGEAKTISQKVTVAQKQATVDVATSSKVDNSSVAKNTKVNFTFVVENQGDTSITDATIKATALNGGKSVCDKFSLEPGKSKIVTYVGTIMKSIVVEPVLSYKSAGKTYTDKMDKVEVTMTESVMTVSATASATSVDKDGTVDFDITVKNSGNVDMKNIKLYDYKDQKIDITTTSLAAGASFTAKATMTMSESGDVSFYVTADDPSGETVTYKSEATSIEVIEPTVDPDAYAKQLSLAVKVNDANYNETGEIEFLLTLTNSGTEPFTDVAITEETIGDIDSVASLAAGVREVTVTQKVAQETEFVFKVTAKDPAGNTISIESPAVTAGTPVKDDEKAGNGFGPLLWIVIIVIVLIIGTGVTLLILIMKEKKNKKNMPMGGAKNAMPAGRANAVPQGGAARRAPQQNARMQGGTPAASPRRPVNTVRRPEAPMAQNRDYGYGYDQQPRNAAPYEEPEPMYAPNSQPYGQAPVAPQQDTTERYGADNDGYVDLFENEAQAQQSAAEPELEEPTIRRRPAQPKAAKKNEDFDDRNSF